MQPFFQQTRPGTTQTHGKATFEVPILYFRDDLFLLFYTADYNKVKALMPSDRLHPVSFTKDRVLVGVGAFNYIDTTIGPYGEVGMVIPVVHSASKPVRILPALMEASYPGFGLLVMHLPVTNVIARDGGRGLWGYTKFVADMNFTITPEYMECRMREMEDHILTLRVTRKGMAVRDKKPLVTYSVKDGRLIKTIIPNRGAFRLSIAPGGSFLELGAHPVAQSFGDLDLSAKPLMSRYYIERSAILPAGEVIEEGVRPLDGYFGKDRDGRHDVNYLG